MPNAIAESVVQRYVKTAKLPPEFLEQQKKMKEKGKGKGNGEDKKEKGGKGKVPPQFLEQQKKMKEKGKGKGKGKGSDKTAIEWTERGLERAEREWSRIAGEPVRVEEVKGKLYAYGSELGMLRLYIKFNPPRGSGPRAAYSANMRTWYFSPSD